jgi:hypothetical protein
MDQPRRVRRDQRLGDLPPEPGGRFGVGALGDDLDKTSPMPP